MTGETPHSQQTQSRRDVLRTLGTAAVGTGAIAGGAGTAAAETNFQLEILEHPKDGELVAGQSAPIRVEVINRGDDAGTQDVTVTPGRDTEPVSLASGAKTEITLDIRPRRTQYGDTLVEVSCLDDDEGVRIDILEPAKYELDISETNSPVVEGREIEATLSITNEGEANQTKTARYRAREKGSFGQLLNEKDLSVSAPGGETTKTQLPTIETRKNAPLEIELTVAAKEDQTVDETIQNPTTERIKLIKARDPIFNVKNVTPKKKDGNEDKQQNVREGEPATVVVTLFNNGHFEGTKPVTVTLGEKKATKEVTIPQQTKKKVEFTVPTVYGMAGKQDITVETPDDEGTGEIEIKQSPFFAVSIQKTNTAVPQNHKLNVDVKVENVGGAKGTDVPITASLIDIGTNKAVVKNSKKVTLGIQESKLIEFPVNVGDAGFGSYELLVTSGHAKKNKSVEKDRAKAKKSIRVANQPYFEISNVSTNAPVPAGSTLKVTATVKNTGTALGRDEITAQIGNVGSGSKSIQLEAGKSKKITINATTSPDGKGKHTLRILTGSSELRQNITLNEAVKTGTTPTATPAGGSDDGGGGGGGGDSVSTPSGSGSSPGFGIGTALTGLGGAGYLLTQRLDGENDDEDS